MRLEEAAPRREGLLAAHRRARRSPTPTSGAEPGAEPRPLRFLGEEAGEHRVELRSCVALVVRLEDPRLGLDDLPERPERDALAVGQAAAVAPRDDVRPLVERGAELGHEPALADPGLADDRDELHGRLALGAEERLEQERALVLAADEWAVRGGFRLADAAPCADNAPHRDRLGLPLCLHRVECLEGDRRFGRAHGRLVDEHRTDGSCRLQTRGGVHDVPGHDALASFRASAESDDRLARRHGRANRELEPLVAQLLDRLQDPEPGAHGPLGVVLVRDRRAEDRHHRVADELLDRSAEALDVGLDALVVGTERRSDVLGIGAVGTIREADEVDEEDRYDLPLLADGGGFRQTRAARETEARSLRVLLAARRADDHGRIFAAAESGVYAAVGRSGGS